MHKSNKYKHGIEIKNVKKQKIKKSDLLRRIEILEEKLTTVEKSQNHTAKNENKIDYEV